METSDVDEMINQVPFRHLKAWKKTHKIVPLLR